MKGGFSAFGPLLTTPLSNLLEPPYIGKNSEGGIFDFWISGQSLVKENCRNFKISYDAEMKLEPETKLDDRNRTTLKRLSMVPCRQIVTSLSFFFIYDQFGAIHKPGFGRTICKTYIFIIISGLLSCKIWRQNLKISNAALTVSLWVKVTILPKNAGFCRKMLKSAKFRDPCY